MSPTEFVKEVNDALRLPPTIGTSRSSAEPAPFSVTVPPFAGDNGIFGGVSALAALPFATASALGEGVAKSAEGVAGALAGLSLGLQEGAGGGGRGGFCTPPEAIEVRGLRRRSLVVTSFPLLRGCLFSQGLVFLRGGFALQLQSSCCVAICCLGLSYPGLRYFLIAALSSSPVRRCLMLCSFSEPSTSSIKPCTSLISSSSIPVGHALFLCHALLFFCR